MKKIRINFLLLLIGFLPIQIFAQQDITGVWSGELVFMDSAKEVHLPYEILVSESKGKYTGYSRITFTVNEVKEYGLQDVAIKMKGNQAVITDEGFIEHNFSINPSDRVKKTMELLLETNDTVMVLKGSWSTNRTKRYIPMQGTAILQRKIAYKNTAIYKRLDTLQKTAALNITTPIAIARVEKKAVEAPVVAIEEVVPDINIPAIEKPIIAAVEIRAIKKPTTLKVVPFTAKQKKQLQDVSKMVIKLPPPPKPTPVVVVVAKAPPINTKIIQDDDIEKPVAVVVKPTVTTPKPAVIAAPKAIVLPVEIVAPSVTKGAVDVDKRTNKLEKAVYFQSDSLVLTLYDNGEVDGDTVTVIMNGNIIFSKQGLSTKANSKTIQIPSSLDSVNLVMYAESLGEIPPNTGLLVVLDGEKRYEIRFSADLKSNAAIIFRRKKNE
jgi:hypothetical protein